MTLLDQNQSHILTELLDIIQNIYKQFYTDPNQGPGIAYFQFI